MDECLTIISIRQSIRELLSSQLIYFYQSPLYFVFLKGFAHFTGLSELSTRLPSIIFTLATGAVLYRIALHFLEAPLAALSVVFFFTLDDVLASAVMARPFAFSLFFAALSLWSLILWRSKGTLWPGMVYVAATALAIYGQPTFAILPLLHLPLFLPDGRESQKIGWGSLLAAFAAIALALVPIFGSMKQLAVMPPVFWIKTPGFNDLVRALGAPFPWIAVFATGIAILAFPLFRPDGAWRRSLFITKPKIVFLLLVWTLGPLLFHFLISITTDLKTFSGRYYLLYALGFPILFAAFIRAISNIRATIFVVAISSVVSIVYSHVSNREFLNDDWAGAATWIRLKADGWPSAVLISAGYIEGTSATSYDDDKKKILMSSPLLVYNVPAILIPVPPNTGTRELGNVAGRAVDFLDKHPVKQVFIVTKFWNRLLMEGFTAALKNKYGVCERVHFGIVWVVRLESMKVFL